MLQLKGYSYYGIVLQLVLLLCQAHFSLIVARSFAPALNISVSSRLVESQLLQMRAAIVSAAALALLFCSAQLPSVAADGLNLPILKGCAHLPAWLLVLSFD
jgi:hypothetical protein